VLDSWYIKFIKREYDADFIGFDDIGDVNGNY